MRQRIIIAKIAGIAAETTISKFRQWSEARLGDNPSAPYTENCCVEMEQFAQHLRSNSELPPVLFFCEYLDMWSMGDTFERYTSLNGEYKFLRVHSNQSDLICYPMPDNDALVSALAAFLQETKREQFSQEEWWFIGLLYEAALSWKDTYSRAVIVVIRRVLGVTYTDEEIIRTFDILPTWLQGEE